MTRRAITPMIAICITPCDPASQMLILLMRKMRSRSGAALLPSRPRNHDAELAEPKVPRQLTPQLLRRQPSALHHCRELQVRDIRLHWAKAGEGPKPAVGTGDDSIPADDVGIPLDSLGHQ